MKTKKDCDDSGRVPCGSGSKLRQPKYGHLEAERGKVEVSPGGIEICLWLLQDRNVARSSTSPPVTHVTDPCDSARFPRTQPPGKL
jgi:hypothetical protein